MGSNLANIYAYLLKKCGESPTVIYSLPSSYLCNIIGMEKNEQRRKVVFVYEDIRVAMVDLISPERPQFTKKTDLDLTGSPLKDDCVVENINDLLTDVNILPLPPWKLEEECHKGIAIEKAQALVNNEDFQCGGADMLDAKGSVWFLCNGSDTKKTILLQSEFGTDGFSRGIVTFTGTVPVKAISSIQPMIDIHCAGMRQRNAIESSIENIYQIKNDVKFRCAWSTTTAKTSLIDLSTCNVTLLQKFNMSDCSHLAQDLMNQLRVLTCIREDIVEYNETERSDPNKEPIFNYGTGIDMDELHETISKIMTEVSAPSDFENYEDIDYNIEAFVQKAPLRNVSDLTDKLWGVLRRCSSYKDLKMAFNILFKCTARCNIVNTPTNKNRLAEIITELSNRRLALPCLIGTEPLELLLEIGLEKLFKDYEYIFTESKICSVNLLKSTNITVNELENTRKSLRNTMRSEAITPRKTLLHNVKVPSIENPVDDVGFKNSNFDEMDTATRLAKLLQIHCTLEHLLKLQIHLNVSNVFGDICETLLTKPIKPLTTTIDETFTDEIEIPLSARNVLALLENKDPFSRCITLKSKNKFQNVQTTFFYSMENVCPPRISECFQCDDAESSRENIYYTWRYRYIQNLNY